MAITKPYKLIIRPFVHQSTAEFDYIRDKSGITSYRQYIRAFELLEKDLTNLFDYIEPNDKNKYTYSHKIYELFLRACTEFEANAKFILKNNGNAKAECISDYWKLNDAMKLSDYLVKINVWNGKNIIRPFAEWSKDNKSLKWYGDYNCVKHDRVNKFDLANLDNLVKAISAVRIILYAQYDFISFNSSYDTSCLSPAIDGFNCKDESIFAIKFNGQWGEDDKYDFNWGQLCSTSEPYQEYDFD